MNTKKLDFPEKLYDAAQQAFKNAYAPYSQFHVGAAALTVDNQVVAGCNVENASYGLTVCAERNCLSNAVVNGMTKFQTMVIYTEEEKLTPPCGACRQVIAEFFEPQALVYAVNHNKDCKVWSLNQLLPDAFLPADLLD